MLPEAAARGSQADTKGIGRMSPRITGPLDSAPWCPAPSPRAVTPSTSASVRRQPCAGSRSLVRFRLPTTSAGATKPSSPIWVATIATIDEHANQMKASQPLRSSRDGPALPGGRWRPWRATPASAVAVALTPSAPSKIHSVRRNTNTAGRIHSSRDIGPISLNRSRASSGDSGVWVGSSR